MKKLLLGLVLLFLMTGGVQAQESSESTRYTYRPTLTSSEVAQALGIDESLVLSVTTSASQCVVEFARPLRTDRNTTFDREGNILEEEVLEVIELGEEQERVLSELMSQASCGRLWQKEIVEQ